MPTLIITAAAFLLASPFLLAQSSALDAVKAEPLLDKRAAKAVDAASQSVTDARKSYEQSEFARFESSLAEVTAAMDLAIGTLEAMGKHPSRNTRNYKVVEMKTRDLLRRITTLRQDVGFEDRPKVEKVEGRVTAIHEKLVEGVMSRKP